MEKEYIISEIIRTAKENEGKPLGIDRFRDETGIKKDDWYGIHWAKWSDAQIEAGLRPNQFGEQPIDLSNAMLKIASLIRELDKIPTKPEFKLKRNSDPSYPSIITIRKRLGNKDEMVNRIKEFCIGKEEWEDVARICDNYINSIEVNEISEDGTENSLEPGQVYLLKHDKVYKIGRSTDAARRYKEIKVQMPMKTEEIHLIETDDTVGIEAYWHRRFSEKRLEGEWFALSNADVKAFKRRRFM